MLTIYHVDENHTLQVWERVPPEEGESEAWPTFPLWVDILSPTPDEVRIIEQRLDLLLPNKEEVWINETLNRFYEEDSKHYLTAAIISKIDGPYPHTSPVTFVLTRGYLLTLRTISPTSFQRFALRLKKQPHLFPNGARVLEGLLEEIISRVAYNAEAVVAGLDDVSHCIFADEGKANMSRNSTTRLQGMLKKLGQLGDLNSKINESLNSLERLVDYFSEEYDDPSLRKVVHVLQTDVQALLRQTAFLSDKITFLQEGTLGMINVEQNLIIKFFSVIAAFFLPPTLISSIYGMNFEHMPELRWMIGYPMSLGLMAMCGIAPYIYFRRKGWL